MWLAAEENVDQRGRESDLADAEGGAEVGRAEERRHGGSGGERRDHDGEVCEQGAGL